MKKRVTAIITTHERPAEILERAIKSVLAQTYKVEEIYVVDDSPSYHKHSEIVNLVKTFSNSVTYILNDKRIGANGSRNIGIENSTCEYIALLDDDDEWTEDHVERLLSKFTDENIGIAYGNQDICEDGKCFTLDSKRKYFEGNVYNELIRYGNFVGGCSIPVLRKKAILEAGMFDEKMPACQDLDLWIRIAKLYEVRCVNSVVVHYYVSKDAITSFPEKRIEGWKMIMDKYSDSFFNNSNAKNRIVNNMVIVSCTYGKFKEAISIYSSYYSSQERIKNISSLIKGIAKWGLLKFRLIER